MTPAQARLQRVMAPRARGPGRPSRRPQPLGQFGQRRNPQAISDQFKRQRKASRLTADAARQYQLTGPGPHRHPRHSSPGQEQRHRLRRNRRAALTGNSHRLHPPHAFRLDIQRDTARRQNPKIRGPPGQLPAGTPGRFQHMLAVVHNQQRPAARHRFGHRLKPRRRLGPPDPHRLNQGGNHLLIAAARHQVDLARQVRPAGRHLYIHAASTASAVFPTPPTPVSVTTGYRASPAAISPRSAVLPTKDGRLGGSRTATRARPVSP